MVYLPVPLLQGSQIIFSFCHCQQCYINMMFIYPCLGTLFLLKGQREMCFKCSRIYYQIVFPEDYGNLNVLIF